MTDELDRIASELLKRELARRAQVRGTPSENEAIERRIADEITADALTRKRERDGGRQPPEE